MADNRHDALLKKANWDSLRQIDLYKLLVNKIQDYAIFLLDSEGYISTWNLGAQKLKGYKPEEIIGKHFSVFYTPEDLARKKPQKELEDCKVRGHIEDEYWRVKKDGSRFWANVIITALRDKSGRLIGYAKVTRDLTERKRQEDQLRAMNKMLQRQSAALEALNTSKDEFISLASHQLRTPATGVKQFLGLVLDGYAGELTDEQRRYLERAYVSNDRQIDLVNDLLRVAQVDAGKVTLDKKTADLTELVKDVVEEQRDTFKKRRQHVTVSLPGEPLPASIDVARFRMVIENLVNNASKYTPEDGSIRVTLSDSEASIAISIRDTGVGIAPDSVSKLFQKFSRIPNHLSDTVGGSGLGLYWAQKITELHGGSIDIRSVLDKGSEFIITVPKGKKS